ncbi:MAG: hypothetical protein LV479_09265 [Methylacidiphilales bacterium]|nr:hypothetical protein [Candidatus Methylacidiphilales bacterium]
MKLSRLLILVVPLLLAACGLSDQQKADYAAVQRSGVSSAVYDKMMHGDALSLYDIKALARAHVSDAVTLRYLRDHGTVYTLNSSDVESLHAAGVSQSVIDYMLQTPRLYPAYPYAYPYPYGPWWGPYPYPYVYYGPYYHYHHWH